MQARAYMLILLFGLGFILSSLEAHPCSDVFKSQVSEQNYPDDHILIAGMDNQDEDLKHEIEFCHFGHCSHARAYDSGLALSSFSRVAVFQQSPYSAPFPSGELRSTFRPPTIL